MLTENFKEENAAKYQDESGKDIFARLAEINPIYAFIVCVAFAAKYLQRYPSKSQKAGNEKDILKAFDCLNRSKEYAPQKLLTPVSLLIEALKNLDRSNKAEFKLLNAGFFGLLSMLNNLNPSLKPKFSGLVNWFKNLIRY